MADRQIPVLDINGVSELCGCHPNTIRLWMTRRWIPQWFRLNRRVLWERRTIEAWIENGMPWKNPEPYPDEPQFPVETSQPKRPTKTEKKAEANV